jgi:hypothetical protein
LRARCRSAMPRRCGWSASCRPSQDRSTASNCGGRAVAEARAVPGFHGPRLRSCAHGWRMPQAVDLLSTVRGRAALLRGAPQNPLCVVGS